ncbi:MAG: FHA domain-containing protein [Planctomycetaceae bacterium]|nr:FHA domain-containing protein [Planctomycetaceae bacterium]
MYGYLIPVSGGDPIPLRKQDLTVGRHDSCDIVLSYSNVSSKHCRLVLSAGYWYILDLRSTNGVKLNGKRVTDRRVDPGATLAISKHIFTVQYNPADNGAVGAPPAEVYQENDIMSHSLMERAGLERPSHKRREEPGSTVPDMPVVVTPPVKNTPTPPSERKDFFSTLKFD